MNPSPEDIPLGDLTSKEDKGKGRRRRRGMGRKGKGKRQGKENGKGKGQGKGKGRWTSSVRTWPFLNDRLTAPKVRMPQSFLLRIGSETFAIKRLTRLTNIH